MAKGTATVCNHRLIHENGRLARYRLLVCEYFDKVGGFLLLSAMLRTGRVARGIESLELVEL